MKVISKKNSILQNSIWLFVLQVFNTVLPLLTIPYITRVLGSSSFGSFSLALNWVLYFQVIVEYGFAFWGARKVATVSKRQLQKIFSQILTARLSLLIVTFFIMMLICFSNGTSEMPIICMIILFTMVTGVAFQLTWLFQGLQDMKYITIINATSRLISVILIVLLIKESSDVFLYSFLYSCTYIISAIAGLVIANKRYGLRLLLCGFNDAKIAILEAWPLFISQAMSKVLSGFGVTVLGFTVSNSEIGIYSALYKIPYAMALFFNPISQAIYPDVSIAFSRSKAEGLNRIKRIAWMVLPIFIMFALITIIFNFQITDVLFGREYSKASKLLIPLSLWFVFSIINNFLGIQTLVASGNQKDYSNSFILSAILSVLLCVVLGKLFGSYGIAFATLLSECMLTFILLYCVKKRMMSKSVQEANKKHYISS